MSALCLSFHTYLDSQVHGSQNLHRSHKAKHHVLVNLLDGPNHFLNPPLIFGVRGHPLLKIFNRGVTGDEVGEGR